MVYSIILMRTLNVNAKQVKINMKRVYFENMYALFCFLTQYLGRKFYQSRNRKTLYESVNHFLFKFWRDQTTLDIIEALYEILNSLKGRKNVMPDTSFHTKSVVGRQKVAKIFLKSHSINSCHYILWSPSNKDTTFVFFIIQSMKVWNSVCSPS